MMRNWNFHHLGIPTEKIKEGESYHPKYKFYSTPFGANSYRVQWLRFPKECELPEIFKQVPHLAFRVKSIDTEIKDKKVILGPWEPMEGFRVAIIENEGIPVEFIETEIDDETLARLDAESDYA
ncbi:MAG: hypothetical protein KFB95_00045 [Simkaniaceae bacterium]|nr:MAG: hypothetical protein KFB95_00045 [Simkaniaceae bacterium]